MPQGPIPRADIRPPRHKPPNSPQSAIGSTKRRRSADRPLHPPRKRAIVNRQLWFQLDERRRGRAEAIETFQTIQNRLNGIARVPARKDISEDFSLRGFVLCSCCGTPVTANWSKGMAAHYPYYLCRQKDCAAKGKQMRREVVEQEFEALLKALRTTGELFELAAALFKDLWEQRAKTMKDHGKTLKAELSQIERKIAQLMDRLVEADSESVIRAYEKRIGDLETDRMVICEKIEKCGKQLATYEDTFEHSMGFIANAWKYGKIGQLSTVKRS